MGRNMNRYIVAVIVAVLVPTGAIAKDGISPTVERDAARGGARSEDPAAPFGSQAVSDGALQQVAGREDIAQDSQADLAAGVAGNSVGENAVTGNAQIDGNAFQNMSGLSILNVNTGNNVAINAAMNVNISISPSQ